MEEAIKKILDYTNTKNARISSLYTQQQSLLESIAVLEKQLPSEVLKGSDKVTGIQQQIKLKTDTIDAIQRQLAILENQQDPEFEKLLDEVHMKAVDEISGPITALYKQKLQNVIAARRAFFEAIIAASEVQKRARTVKAQAQDFLNLTPRTSRKHIPVIDEPRLRYNPNGTMRLTSPIYIKPEQCWEIFMTRKIVDEYVKT